jgi:putative transcriptional regulator
LAFDDPDSIDRLDPEPDEERCGNLGLTEANTFASYRPDRRTNMSNSPTSGKKRDKYGMTAEDWLRLEARTDEEITAAAMADPDNRPLTDEQLAQFRRPALAFRIRRKLHMGRETFAATYGIPPETLRAWERHQLEPTEVELAYLRLIEREPEMAKIKIAEPAN